MTDFHAIYRDRADDYDLLVSREDRNGNLLKRIERIRPLAGLEVVEFGAGTGRVTRQIAPMAKSIRAFDNATAMLDVARRRLSELPGRNWSCEVAENDALPVPDGSADLVVAGWTFGHLTGWHPENWENHVRAALSEAKRVLRDDGRAIIVETLGTGRETPQPPTPALARYYEMLERDYGFVRHEIRTDYQFASVEEASRLTRFFFGDELADRVEKLRATVVPECTGVWAW